jgi:hypothetical protein
MKYYLTVEKKVIYGVCIEAGSEQEAEQKYKLQDYDSKSETKLFDQAHRTAHVCHVEDVTKEDL